MAHGKSPKHARKKRKGASRARPSGTARSSRASGSSTARGKGASGGASSAPEAAAAAKPEAGGIRLQKLLASAGFGSRRDVERFLVEERVTVNGRVAKLGDKADPTVDDIRFDGERLARERPSYWLLNKPRGVITTLRDDEGRRTVIDLVPPAAGRVFPVGRLDRETSGLLLLTNDGDTAHVLLHPSLGNEREYRVNVKGEIDSRTIARLERGVPLEEGRTAPARVDGARFDPDTGTTSFSLTLVEGRKRQIRRSLLVLGFPVRRLVRVRMGPLRLGRLAVGEARPLRAEERRALLAHAEQLRSGTAAPIDSARPPRGPARRSSQASTTRPRRPTTAAAPASRVVRKRGVPPAGPRAAGDRPRSDGPAKPAARRPAKKGASKPARGTAKGPAKRAASKRSAKRATKKTARKAAKRTVKKASKKPVRKQAAKKRARKGEARGAGKSASRPGARRPQRAARSRKGVKR